MIGPKTREYAEAAVVQLSKFLLPALKAALALGKGERDGNLEDDFDCRVAKNLIENVDDAGRCGWVECAFTDAGDGGHRVLNEGEEMKMGAKVSRVFSILFLRLRFSSKLLLLLLTS